MTRETVHALLAVGVATLAGIGLGFVLIVLANLWRIW
jgi:hypothetical protein